MFMWEMTKLSLVYGVVHPLLELKRTRNSKTPTRHIFWGWVVGTVNRFSFKKLLKEEYFFEFPASTSHCSNSENATRSMKARLAVNVHFFIADYNSSLWNPYSLAGASSKKLKACTAFPSQALSKARNAKCPPTTGLALNAIPGNPPSPSVSYKSVNGRSTPCQYFCY